MIFLIGCIIFGCSSKAKEPEIIVRTEYVYSDREIHLPYKPKCNDFIGVSWKECDGMYCLDPVNARYLLFNLDNIKECMTSMSQYIDHVCEQDNINCN